MPAPAAFAKGFSLNKGLTLAGYTLTSSQISHTEVVRYREYEFPITLTFQYQGAGEPNVNALSDALHSLLSQTHVINSQYSNPYQCSIVSISHGNISPDHHTVTFNALGKGIRI